MVNRLFEVIQVIVSDRQVFIIIVIIDVDFCSLTVLMIVL